MVHEQVQALEFELLPLELGWLPMTKELSGCCFRCFMLTASPGYCPTSQNNPKISEKLTEFERENKAHLGSLITSFWNLVFQHEILVLQFQLRKLSIWSIPLEQEQWRQMPLNTLGGRNGCLGLIAQKCFFCFKAVGRVCGCTSKSKHP